MDGAPAELLEQLAARDREIERLHEEQQRLLKEHHRLCREGELLRELLRQVRARMFGRSSEKLDALQRDLLAGELDLRVEEIEGEVAAGGAPQGAAALLAEEQETRRERKSKSLKSRYEKPHPGRAALPAHLERIEEVIRLEGEERDCPKCGCEMAPIGHECSERLDIMPARHVVRVVKCEKLACRHCEEGHVRTAPTPPKALERAKATDELVVHMAIQKYACHLPVYRQVAALRSEGINLSRDTIYGWLGSLGELLRPIYEGMVAEVRASSCLQADETRVTVLGDGVTAKGSRTGWFWQYSIPRGTLVYDFQLSRSRAGPAKFLGNFKGTLQCDGYSSYEEVGDKTMRRAGCMAHARRGFADAFKAGEQRALSVIEIIAELYEVEAASREAGLDAEERLTMRMSHSVEIFERLEKAVIELRIEVLPQSACGKACTYFFNQYDRLKLFLEEAALEVDNNLCENGMRPLALGRKNWMFVGSEQAGVRAARIASIVETCRRMEIDPQKYLIDVLAAIAKGTPANQMASLTPKRWKQAQAAKTVATPVA